MPTPADRIEKHILIRAPLDRVWRAIADSTEFGIWFGMRFAEPFRSGARMRGTMAPTQVDPETARQQKQFEGFEFEIVVERIEPKTRFAFRWHPGAVDPSVDYSEEPMTLVEFTLREVPDGVDLTVTESGFDQIPLARRAQAFGGNEHGWTKVVTLIDKYVRNAD
jgi:uncharacterized protein YndB with AHSA1/START domain